MKIIFDLDGTLIDSSERMYRLFQELVPESDFSKEGYWELKRNKVNHRMLLERYFPNYDFDDFNEKWLKRIEAEEYLKTDILYYDSIDTLNALKKRGVGIILLTARQSREGLYQELERLGIYTFFDVILTTEGSKSKESLLKDSGILNHVKNADYVLFVSDMGKDIMIGKEFGLKTIAITHGFMNEKCLSEYKPNIIINNLNEILELI
ncbi:phosphoglycolate phosphatase [Lachnospiraceae bacterium G41]|nr:phosphoglycolate phosphatase [Lachnospiraceae bacterium G41]